MLNLILSILRKQLKKLLSKELKNQDLLKKGILFSQIQ